MVANAVFKGFHSLSILRARTQEQKMDIGQARLYWSDLIIDWHSQDRGFYLSELGMIAGGSQTDSHFVSKTQRYQ